MPKLPEKYKCYNYFTDKDLEVATELRGQGLSYKKIGEFIGFSPPTIMYHLCPEQKEKSFNRHKLLSPEILRRNVHNYQKKYKKVTGKNYSTENDKEHKKRSIRKRNAYREMVGIPIDVNNY